MRREIAVLLLLSLAALTLSACGLLQEPEAPSATLEAIPLELQTPEAEAEVEPEPTTTPVVVEEASADESAPDQSAADESAADESAADEAAVEQAATEEPADQEAADEEAADEETAAGEAADTGQLLIYSIDPGRSEVRFELDEDLRGVRTTVVGRTDQVAGEIAVNLADLSTAQVGVLQINARTLATDNSFRNRAIQNQILETGSFEFITFEPSTVNGLPASAALGEEITFAIEGNLTIRDITQPVTFEITAMAVSETQISGTAAAIVSREAFDLRIPSVRNVANVEEEVELTIDFVANAG